MRASRPNRPSRNRSQQPQPQPSDTAAAVAALVAGGLTVKAAERVAAATAAEAALVALYGWAQVALLTGIGRVLASVPHTREGYQSAIPRMRAIVGQVQATLTVRTGPLLATMVDEQAAAGAIEAEIGVAATTAATPDAPGLPDVTHQPPPPTTGAASAMTSGEPPAFDLSRPHGERAADAIAHDLSSSLANVRERITRLPDDVYKHVAPHAAQASVLDNGLTMRQTQAEAWREFLRHGVTGFTDRSGRRWNLATYTEMAIRTASVRAFNDSHLQRMRALGVRYFQVPPHDTTCPLCWPWEGQVLSDGLQPDADALGCAGTLNDAVNAGLFHPNCRHTLVSWLPGISEPPTPQPPWGPDQQAHYADAQRQRALELRVRRAKEAEALALDPATRTDARKRVRAAQAAVREHLDGKRHLSRDYAREQPNLGYARR